MKKLIWLLPILLCSFSAVYYFAGAGGNTTSLPGGTVSVTPQFRVLGSDSLRNIWINYGAGWNRMYTATEINKYFFPAGSAGYIQNQTALKQPASFRLNGTMMIGTLGQQMFYADSTQQFVYSPTDYAQLTPTQMVLNHTATGVGYNVRWDAVANAYIVEVGGTGRMLLNGKVEVGNAPTDPNNIVRLTDLSAYTTSTRTITAGYGLTGGGDLSANRTLIVDTSAAIVSKTFAARYIRAASTDVLLNKTISGSSNTLTNIPNSALTNSTISGVALGGTLANLTATDGSLTFSGTYTGATPRTVGLNVANGNSWTAGQVFSNATYPITISRAAGNATGWRLARTGNLSRFDDYIDATTESGGNAGSDNYKRAFDDAGTFLGFVWGIKRSTQVVRFYQPFAITGVTTGTGGTDSVFVSNNGVLKKIAATYYAPLVSPAFTGNPTAPTQAAGDNSTKIATTAYVDGAITNAITQVVEITGTSQTAAASRIYIPHNAALTTVTIPTTTIIGTLYQIVGEGAGGWKVQLTAGQTAKGVGITTTSGGSIASTDRYCTITMRLAAANTFVITSSQGTLTPL